MNIYIVIPAYNEARKIQEVLDRVLVSYKNVVVVDDGSKDQTYEILGGNNIIYTRHSINRGQGAALQTGTDIALKNGADIIVHFDADGQMRVEDIKKLCNPIIEGTHDVVFGSRFLGEAVNIPPLRLLILKIAKLFNRFFLGIRLSDPSSGFRVLSKHSAEKIQITQDGMAHCNEIQQDIFKQKLRVKELPVTIEYTDYSIAKGQKGSNAFKIVKDLFIGNLFK